MSAAPRSAIVGTGPVSRALTRAYALGGGRVDLIVSRCADRGAEVARRLGATRGSSDLADALSADVVLVAVPDRALAEVATRVAAHPAANSVLFLHTSGALPGDVLRVGRHRAGSLHPLQSFPDGCDDAQLAARMTGTHWFHEGDGAQEAGAIVTILGGTLHRLAPGAKALYHAGAAVLSNHTVALFDSALELFAAAGVPREEAHAPLAALLAGTSANLAALGVPAALTGPIARGDVDTVRRHLDAIARDAPVLRPSYVEMARRTLVVARAKGSITEDAADELERLLG